MCGIAGFIDFTGQSDLHILQKMTDELAYRGPDDFGYDVYDSGAYKIGLGHRRLSIIDLSHNGHQPMHLEEVSIVFNGEIYNFAEIKRLLSSDHGCQFQTASDTEVILHAYKIWGMKCIERFIGMFAFVISDKKIGKVFLVRDRVGEKPLYYYQSDNLILFSSSLKSFHQHPNFIKKINFDTLGVYLQYGFVPAPFAIFEHSFKVLPGTYLEFDSKTKKFNVFKYWDVLDHFNKPELIISEQDAILETEKLLYQSCQYRMVSDAPVGVFLSGGYDSSCVTAMLQKDKSERINTFTIGFENAVYNEAPHAKSIAEYLGTNHTEYYCTEKDAQEIIPKLPVCYDEPFGDSSAIPTMLLSKVAAKKIKVALASDGGDEIFAGYNRYPKFLNLYKKLQSIPEPIRKILPTILQGVSPDFIKFITGRRRFATKYDLFRELMNGENTLSNSYKYTHQRISHRRLKRLLKVETNQLNTFFDFSAQSNRLADNLSGIMTIDFKTYLPDDILVKVDRASMFHSLEGREPMLDHRLIEFAAQIPVDLKLNGSNKKYILKEITYKYLPKNLIEKEKMGFGIPIHNWFRKELKELLTTYLNSGCLIKQGIFNEICVQEMLDNYYSGNNEDFELIWFMLVFQLWYEKWM